MNSPTPRILVIDDEISCLDLLKKSLAPKENAWTIERSNNPQQALDAIKSNPPAVVICDYRMPQMNGADLLAEVEKAHPSVHRLIMADRDERGLLEAGIGSVFHYLPKPCPSERLVSEIQRCLSIDSWLGADRIRRIAENVGALPCLPPLYSKVINALESEDCTLDQVAKEISTDISISAKILQIVNSSYFGFEQEISDISQAVAMLGIEIVKNLVLALQVFEDDGSPADKAFVDKLWRHSLEVANGSKAIAQFETENRKRAEEAYASGLFHDLGKLIIQRAKPEEYRDACTRAELENLHPVEAELQTVGCNHAEVGAYLLARWGLPAHVVESAALHHEQDGRTTGSFTSLVAVQAANDIVSKTAPLDGHDKDRLDQLAIWSEVIEGKEPSPKKRQPKDADNPQGNESQSTPQKASTIVDQSNVNDTSNAVAIQGKAPFLPPPSPKRDAKTATYAIFGGFCATVCLSFALFLFTKRDPYKTVDVSAYQTGETKTQAVSGEGAYDASKSSPESDLELGLTEQGLTPSEAIAVASTEKPIDRFPRATQSQAGSEEIAIDPNTDNPRDLFPKIRVSGIFYNLPKPAASVNGQILRVGDSVSGARVIAIEKGNIVIQYADERRAFSLKE